MDVPGFEFTIRTPSKPSRWQSFEKECDFCFRRSEDALLSINNMTDVGIGAGQSDEELLKRGLELFYWWVVFAPLSRGTAACGYAALQAVVISGGKMIMKKIPKGKQLDWEVCRSIHLDSHFWSTFSMNRNVILR